MKNITRSLVLAAALGAGISPLLGDSVAFTNGNLILSFQATGGTGSNKNVYFILGSGTSYRDNGSQGFKGNIGATLSTVFGNDWYERTDLYFGVVGNLTDGAPGSPPLGVGAVNGDPSRTLYISSAVTTPGSSSPIQNPGIGPYSSSALGTAGGNITSMEKVFNTSTSTGGIDGGLPAEPDGSGILDDAIPAHDTAWNNRWAAFNPVPGAALSTFSGGIQQNFGKVGAATYLDVQRILGTNTGASPTGTVGIGTYETTIAIGSDGSITAIVPSASSAFTTWIGGFNPPLSNPADRLEAADPDNDEIENVLEFVLNGNPSVSSPNILPTLNATGTDLVFSFTRRADSASEVAQVFEYSVDLVDWTTNPPVTIPTAPGTSGFATVGASTGTAPNQVQAVTVTLPKGSNTKLFGRLRAVK